jgi:hypothetical protein
VRSVNGALCDRFVNAFETCSILLKGSTRQNFLDNLIWPSRGIARFYQGQAFQAVVILGNRLGQDHPTTQFLAGYSSVDAIYEEQK